MNLLEGGAYCQSCCGRRDTLWWGDGGGAWVCACEAQKLKNIDQSRRLTDRVSKAIDDAWERNR